MSWIKMIPESEAQGDLKKIYKEVDPGTGVANILRIHSLSPGVLRKMFAFYKELMFRKIPGGLSRMEKEMLATVTSVVNQCHY